MKGHFNTSADNHARRLMARPAYPFAAIVGQEEMKLALLLNVIDASIGGVLIMGHRGTGKSTAVRALADLLPLMWRVSDCRYGCDPEDEPNLCADCAMRLAGNGKLKRERGPVPVVELPLGATEDRVCGTIDLERALTQGVKAFEPGLLARAHRGFLYIDEVNLLEDHLVDLLLDAAATGRHRVERESISVEHPSQFVLVGSGNPEEGELRPQLLDRFGLHVEIKTAASLDERVLIIQSREAFNRDPRAFRASIEDEQERLRRQVMRARKLLPRVEIPLELLRRIADLCVRLKTDGHRGELTITRAARALAAFEGRRKVTAADVRRVAAMSLRHRLRRDPFEPTDSGTRVEEQVSELFSESSEETRQRTTSGTEPEPTSSPSTPDGLSRSEEMRTGREAKANARQTASDHQEQDVASEPDGALPPESLKPSSQMQPCHASPRHLSRRGVGPSHRSDNLSRGRYVRAVATKAQGARLALDATLRAHALHARESQSGNDVHENEATRRPLRALSSRGGPASSRARDSNSISPADLRYQRLRRKSGTLYIFAVDTSGSMAANRIGQAKGALARLLERAYVDRDRVSLITFRRQEAELLLPPSRSMTRARRILDALPVGGATPLSAGLSCALRVAQRAARQDAERIALLLFTDGRSNVPLIERSEIGREERQRLIEGEIERLGSGLHDAGAEVFVIDTQQRFTSRGEALALANRLRGRHIYLASADGLNSFDGFVRETERAGVQV